MTTASATLAEALSEALTRELGQSVGLSDLRQLPGGASKETWQLTLTLARGPQRGEHVLILLRQMGGKIYAHALDLLDEYRVIQAAHATGVPTPRPFAALPDLLGRPAVLVERLPGESIGRKVVKNPELASARARLPQQLGAALAAIHRTDTATARLRGLLTAPPQGQTPAQGQIEQLERDLDQIGEPHPTIELCLRWLRRHEPPPPERLVLVHGDYRIGNLLVTSEGLSGVIDWEFAHLGDPLEDLAWGLIREWRFGVDALRFGGVGPAEDFFAAYAAGGGEPVNPEHAFYWEVMHNVRWAVGTLNQAQRHLSGLEPNLEFASLGRRCAEMELEAVLLIETAQIAQGKEA
jgi:aminoglycoside phosphotransferase (APT) family kinase protein